MSITANPLFLRVLFTSGKRQRDLIIRCAYLGLLIAIVFLTLLNLGGTSLDQLAGASAQLFVEMSYAQLALIALLAPIFTAAAITQEQDAQTYDVLLCTPMSNTQIVVGSLFSRIFFLIALLISGVPVFAITQIFGGVAVNSIFLSFAIAAATAMITGSFALTVATFRVGNRRPVFGFYFVLLIYLLGLWLLDSFSFFHLRLTDGTLSNTSWLTGLNPFLALRVVFNNPQAAPPNLAQLPVHWRYWPFSWYWTNPASFYVTAMLLLSGVLILPATLFLRRAAQTTINWRNILMNWVPILRIGPTRKPRAVWNNPIAWRQARSKGSAARGGVFRYALILAGLIAAVVMLVMYANVQIPGRYVMPSSWDAQHQTIMIIDSGQSTPYIVNSNANVTINGKNGSLDQLTHQFSVSSISARGDHIDAIDLVDPPRSLSQEDARKFLLILTIVEFAAILIMVTNAAASTVTREKEDGTLDLLLATPITSRYYIWGKLRGLVLFAVPLIAVPIISLLLFVIYDLFNPGEWTAYPEALLALPPVFVVTAALAAMLGMQMSLACRKTVAAVMSSLGIVAGICGALAWVGWEIATTSSNDAATAAAGIASFSPFTLPMLLVDPTGMSVRAMNPLFMTVSDIHVARLVVLLCAWIAATAYAGIVWTMYRSMVRNFDMTIRRQAT
ncbi:MAG TPA: ABC transporter permease subunit [Tepidisphaeraceae bacterium]|jgi:ABC-type transport system involved in multi-copper enzyme maturation permease subunit